MSNSIFLQPSFQEEMNDNSEQEQIVMLIDTYTNLQRIKTASDRDNEIENQLKVAKAKLEVFGVAAENLEIH